MAQTSLVLDAKGRALAALHGPEDRTAVPLDRVSRWMRLAMVDTALVPRSSASRRRRPAACSTRPA
ncbi:MAG TPA: hypothetical protein VFX88_14740 [Actinomycetota bacterium]|nr:hypothetical protein [Actinomycetota bacterium]